MLLEQGLAVEAVDAVRAGKSLTPSLERLFARHPELAPSQRAAVIDIANGTLRQLGLLRRVLAQMLRKPLEPQALEGLLVVALFQLAFTRAAAHAVVENLQQAAALI